MDGTRIICIIELYRDYYLVGKAFPPDVHCFPKPEELDKVESWQQVQEYVYTGCKGEKSICSRGLFI